MSKADFDYIVIGAGSAGCVVAARLSEDPAAKVLLLEAGGWDRHPWFSMPLAFRNALRLRGYGWGLATDPEPTLGNRVIDLPRGKVIGGTGSVNAMSYVRGHPTDYDGWRQQGCTGWSFAEVLPYFKRAETNWRGAGPYHGADGPQHVTEGDSPHELWEQFRDSAVAAGHPLLPDYNGGAVEGVGRVDLNIARGRRSSTARGHLYPALDRPNLNVEVWAQTTRILVERGRAMGVEYREGGQLHRAHAAAEVVVCGGAYHSPHLLLLSGIGPADELRAAGVAPVHDLPGVGKNLGDHPMMRMEYAVNRPVTFVNQIRLDRAVLSTLRWLLFHDGPFTTVGTAGRVFARSLPGLERPDIMFTFNPLHWGVEPWLPLLTPTPPHRFASLIEILHQESRGSVRLRSSDPADSPRILHNYFATPGDMAAMIRALRTVRKMFAVGPLAALVSGETEPGVDCQSDAALEAFIRRTVISSSHPVGTCAMGIHDQAVVDPELRVRGLEGVRVADASIMPEIVGGNTNAPTVMIAEKAADMIRGRTPLPQA